MTENTVSRNYPLKGCISVGKNLCYCFIGYFNMFFPFKINHGHVVHVLVGLLLFRLCPVSIKDVGDHKDLIRHPCASVRRKGRYNAMRKK